MSKERKADRAEDRPVTKASRNFLQHHRRGFTLVELLAVIAIVGLLTSLIVPGLQNGRREAARVHCLSNLRSIASASLSYSVDDPHSLPLPAHPTADRNTIYDDGYFDFGGASGSSDMWNGMRVGPRSRRTADTRPLNRWLGLTGQSDGDYAVFACPADERFDPPANYVDWVVWEPRFRDESASTLVGTSYWGNACKGRYSAAGKYGPTVSISPWLRPVTRIPYPSQTVLYMEMPVAFNLTYSLRAEGVRFGFRGLAGWHGGDPPRFNLALCDGSAKTMALPAGVLLGTDPGEHALRVSTVRFDCYPDRPIVDLPSFKFGGESETPGG
jgi:prepilin-type N-terminal cleavage/methylation domain-containing protein